MSNFIRFEIITKDRMGITVEILEEIYKEKINLISVEVFSKKVCVKLENIDEDKKLKLKNKLYSINDVISVQEIELLNYETNERKLLTVIDSVDEGIIAVNKNYNIEIFNSYCEKAFHHKRDEILNKDIRSLIENEEPLINLIKSGKEYDNKKMKIKTLKGKNTYITTGRTINGDNNNIIGGVVSIKDINKAIELVDIISSTQEGAFKEIIGNSFPIERIKSLVIAVAKSNSTILLRGESGTGKELFAKAIKNLSSRDNEKFVTVNCAAIPDALLESELFGYEKGSFTGAINSGKDGLFKEAHGGTLFLDEIGELSMVLQAKLLRVLQEGVIRKIGSNVEEKVDVRIIAATNKNLEEMIKNKEFREDLYYRLNVIPIVIPPLRERMEDIPALVNYFIYKLNIKLNKNIKGAHLEFTNMLMEYDWPGNIRELQNVVERTMNLCDIDYLTIDNFLMVKKDFDYLCIGNNFEKNSELSYEYNGLKLEEIVEICEKQAIEKALFQTKSYRKAAKLLGVSHTTIMNKANKYRIGCKK